MNILHKVQLLTVITIIASISILIYIDSVYAEPDFNPIPEPFTPPLEIFEPPLKQVKAGVPIQDIQCNEGLFLIHKQDTLSPACVGDIAFNDLVFPPYGWAVMRLGAPAEPMSQEAMCEWYPDVKLVQNSCKNIEYSGVALDDKYGNVIHFRYSYVCTEQMIEHLHKYSNIYSYEKNITLETNGLPDADDNKQIDFNQCLAVTEYNKQIALENYQLEKVLDHCDCQKSGQVCTTAPYKWENSTHHIDNVDCKWIRYWDGFSHPYGYEPDYTDDFEIDYTEKFD